MLMEGSDMDKLKFLFDVYDVDGESFESLFSSTNQCFIAPNFKIKVLIKDCFGSVMWLPIAR